MINSLQITFSTYHSHAQIPLIAPLCLIIFPTLYQVFKEKISPKGVTNELSTKLIWLKLCNNQSIFFYPKNMPYLSVCLCMFSHSWNVSFHSLPIYLNPIHSSKVQFNDGLHRIFSSHFNPC